MFGALAVFPVDVRHQQVKAPLTGLVEIDLCTSVRIDRKPDVLALCSFAVVAISISATRYRSQLR